MKQGARRASWSRPGGSKNPSLKILLEAFEAFLWVQRRGFSGFSRKSCRCVLGAQPRVPLFAMAGTSEVSAEPDDETEGFEALGGM